MPRFRTLFFICKKQTSKNQSTIVQNKKNRSQSIYFEAGVKIRGCYVWLQKLGWVRFVKSQDIAGTIRGAFVRKSTTGKWYVSIVCEREFDHLPKVDSIVGVDVGLRHYATLSDGTKVDNPRWLNKSLKKLARLQRSFSRKVLGSSNRQKAKLKVAKQHERIANQRRDFQHKLSTKLVNENQVIGVESLSLTGLIRSRLSKSFSDAGLGEFLSMLKYKCEWYGRTLVEVDRFFPSSKTCSCCGVVNSELAMEEFWVCCCGAKHNRDLNAAINLRNVAVGTPRRKMLVERM